MQIKVSDMQEIVRQVEHCINTYLDEPPELAYKLVNLVSEWYIKGLQHGKILEKG